jgi:hypothetical protein
MKYIITENKLDKVALTWLNNNFGDLTPIVEDEKTYYVNEDRLPLFYYVQDSKNDNVFINYYEIWSFLESMFDMDYQQIQGVIRDWLEETYNLKGITPIPSNSIFFEVLEETYNLKEMKYIITENKLDKVALTWLSNNFGNLTPIVEDEKTYYVNEDKLPLFFYFQKEEKLYIYIDYDEIWSVLETMFSMGYNQIQEFIPQWLEETYNLKSLIPTVVGPCSLDVLEDL